MKLKGKFAVILVALAFILGSACIALAGGGMDQQTGQATVSGSNQNVNSSGAMRVDQDYRGHLGVRLVDRLGVPHRTPWQVS